MPAKKVNENRSPAPLLSRGEKSPRHREGGITVRLTLRTLLAYLDDTLEPAEIKKIGQKVAESDAAQELIARIKQVTRRRRITTPPATGPNAFDPNMVAEYLDNELSSDQLAELEKICLESDVHLSEVASCHQILTLVLGEPALVPPTAKERMYALVQGREAIPFRKAAAASGHGSAPTAADADADEMFLLGLPFYRRGTWLRWALPLAGVVLLVVVAVALWQSIAPLNPSTLSNPVVAVNKPDNTQSPPPDNTKPPPDNTKPPPDNTKPPPDNTKPPPDNTKPAPPDNPPPSRPGTSPEARKAKPSTDRAEVGSYYFDPKSTPSILVQRKKDEDSWHRLKSGTKVFTSDRLVSLPGYASELRLDSGVHLLLRGHVREFSPKEEPEMDFLQESAVVLHKNPDVDADVTFDRGRLYLSNHKDKDVALVRLRFVTQVWDLTLDPGAEVVLDLLKRYLGVLNYMAGEEPLATLHCLVLKGHAGLAIEYQHFPNLSGPPGPAYFRWENKGDGAQGPGRVDRVPPFFAKTLRVSGPLAEAMELALKQVSLQMSAEKIPTDMLETVLQNAENPVQHMLAIYCLGALDEVKKLIGVLGDQDPTHAPDRDTAIFTLRNWLSRDAQQGPKLYDEKNNSGLLLSDREYRSREAEAIFRLLHDFNEEEKANPETYDLLANYLLSEKVAIAELARYHLLRLSRGFGIKLASLDRFNAAIPRDAPERQLAAKEVRDKINEGLLPPRTAGRSGAGTSIPPKTGPGSVPKPKK
jgi:hypothetical protein